MTTGRSLKRLIRARMVQTGERYMAARRAILERRHESGRPGGDTGPVESSEDATRLEAEPDGAE